MSRVLVPLANGVEELEAVTIVDVLRRGGVEVVTASIHDDLTIRGAHGMTLQADALFEVAAAEGYAALVLPGGGEGTENLKVSEALLERLRRQKEEGGLLCAICAAPTVLVRAGVLEKDQHVTCYPTCQMELDRRWVNQPVIVHENIITGQAPGTALLFALVILQQLEGNQVASSVARAMVTDVFV